MKLAQILVAVGFFLMIGCSTSKYAKRDVANVPSIPTECALPVVNLIQRVQSTVAGDATVTSAQLSCKNGNPWVLTQHPDGRSMAFSLPSSNQPGEAGHMVMATDGTATHTELMTFPAAPNVANQNRLRLVFSNFSADFFFDRANLTRMRAACRLLNRPVTVGTTPSANTFCPMNAFARSPITRFSHNGTARTPQVAYSCLGGEPRYKISMTTGSVTEEIDLGASDGTSPSAISFTRFEGQRSGVPLRTAGVSGNHSKNVLAENRLAIQARDQNFLVEFDPEMLFKHQQWCAIASQTVETVAAAAPAQPTAPAVEDPVTDPVILQ